MGAPVAPAPTSFCVREVGGSVLGGAGDHVGLGRGGAVVPVTGPREVAVVGGRCGPVFFGVGGALVRDCGGAVWGAVHGSRGDRVSLMWWCDCACGWW